MASIRGLQSLVGKLREMAAKASKESNVSAIVGYTASYAVYVHENVEMKWKGLPRSGEVRMLSGAGGERTVTTGHAKGKGKGFYWGPHGQAKFLEQPMRELSNSGEFSRIIFKALSQKKTMAQALLLAGLKLQRDSQKLVPVEFGNLRASAFTRLE